MKHKKIIFVCTGNTCRSPMAAAAFKHELKRRKIAWYTVQSAGLAAAEGYRMSPHSAQALTEAKIPFEQDFASRLLTDKMIEEAYAVICMTDEQYAQIAQYKNATSMRILAGREIPDPFGCGIEVYRETLRAIRLCLPRIIEGLGMEKKE